VLLRSLSCALLLLGSAAGCRKEEPHGLMASGKPDKLVIKTDQLGNRAELGKSLRMPLREAMDRIKGGLHVAETHMLRVSMGGQPAETLDETVKLETDANKQWHAVRENSREQGIEAWWADDALTVRMRYGKPVRRRPEGTQVDDLRENLFGALAADWNLLERFAQVSDDGLIAGPSRNLRKVRLTLASSPDAAPKWAAGTWREQVRVTDLTGEALIDARSGVPERVKLRAQYSWNRNGRTALAELAIDRTIAADTAAAPIQTPADTILAPHRPRYEIERRELLDGLAVDKRAVTK
jgi:hypothetical protein